MTNLEGRVLRRRAAVTPPPGARSELWIMSQLAGLLDAPSHFSADPETVFTELRAASAGGLADYSGIDYALLDRGDAAYWPYPAGSTGTPRLFRERFAHADGRAVLTPVSPSGTAVPGGTTVPGGTAVPAGTLHQSGSLALATGRLLEHYQSGAQTRRVADLLAAQPEQRLQIHPVTAAGLGIADGSAVEVASPRGRVQASALVTADIRPDTVFLAFHYPGNQSANLVTEAVTDPMSGMPEFKTTRVQVRVLETAGHAAPHGKVGAQ